jgi:hypothetical protein
LLVFFLIDFAFPTTINLIVYLFACTINSGIQAAIRAHQLGQCYESIGRSRQAAPMHGRAMQIHKNTLDGLDPRLALSHSHVGRIHTAVGKQTPAKTSMQSAVDIDVSVCVALCCVVDFTCVCYILLIMNEHTNRLITRVKCNH